MKMKIAIAYHKEWQIYTDNNNYLLPIQVGKEHSNIDLSITGDNMGDNISKLNPYYCEMTAMYYLWKNIDSDYLGLCHYRRLFAVNKEPLFNYILNKFAIVLTRLGALFKPGVRFTYVHSIFLPYSESSRTINKTVSQLHYLVNQYNYDIICCKPVELATESVRTYLSRIIGINGMKNLDDIMSTSPYLSSYSELLSNNRFPFGNMILMKKDVFNEYCVFVFDILNKHFANSMGLLKENPVYNRISGYIAEILTATFILSKQKENWKIGYLPSYFIGEMPKNMSVLKRLLFKMNFFHTAMLRN